MWQKLLHRWDRVNPWIRATLQAVLFLLFLHVCVVRWVTVRSTSMYATLLPGDLLLVQRWPLLTGFANGDVVVFRDPLRDDVSLSRRPLLVKRIVGMPGDRVELRNGHLLVNGTVKPFPIGATRSYLVRLKQGRSPDALLEMLGLPKEQVIPGRNFIELPLNKVLADSVKASPDVVSVEPMSSATGAPRHIFPFSPRYAWNGDDYGPITVPKKGDTLHITIDNLPLYDRLMSRYEGHVLTAEGNDIAIDGRPLTDYVVEHDHYFVLGDSRHHSADSRYWGFVPADHLVGRAGTVLLGKGPSGLRGGHAVY